MREPLKVKTRAEALEAIADERSFIAPARVLAARVWVASWGLPGCLNESYAVCTSKAEAIAEALRMIGDDAPRGARADLLAYGRTDKQSPSAWARGAITRVERARIADWT